MGPGSNREPTRGGGRAAMLLIAGATLLSGCSLASSVGSSDNVALVDQPVRRPFLQRQRRASTQPASPTPTAPDFECPGVDIRSGASTLNIAAKAVQATAGDLRYQLSFGQTARECRGARLCQ